MPCLQDPKLLELASNELEALHQGPGSTRDGSPFPHNCQRLLFQISGNSTCIDCGDRNPSWASVTYGVLLCLKCSGRHRSYGVQNSRVRSIEMDAWSKLQILALLEGGNDQMRKFFHRHQLTGGTISALDLQYRTKAARFYKTHLERHVERVSRSGPYQGRELSRKRATAASQ